MLKDHSPMWVAHDYLFHLAEKACEAKRPYEVAYLMEQARKMQQIERRVQAMGLDKE